jgi:hypothetical protein
LPACEEGALALEEVEMPCTTACAVACG